MNEFDVSLSEHVLDDVQFEELMARVGAFHLIILYDVQPNNFDYDYLVTFPSEKLKKTINSSNIFPRMKSETFIIPQKQYEDNYEMYYKLRLRAREEMLLRVTEFMIAKFFDTHENYLAPLITNKPTVKWQLLDNLYKKYTAMLKENTRFNDEAAWESFSIWFKNYLSSCVLQEILNLSDGTSLLERSDEQLRQLFFEKMKENLSSNDLFIDNFTKVVNLYIEKWVTELLQFPETEGSTLEELAGLVKGPQQLPAVLSIDSIVKENYLTIMSNTIYQFISEAISNRKFINNAGRWPRAERFQMPADFVELRAADSSAVEEMQNRASNLTEIDADILDIICHLYLSKSAAAERAAVDVDELLRMRKLKPKLAGTGRRGGFEREQRKQVLKALSIISSIYAEMSNVLVYEYGKPIHKKIQGRIFHFTNAEGQMIDFEEERVDSFYIRAGEVFDYYLRGSSRQIKLMPKTAVEYNPYQKKWEKKLIRYISWRWRTQARKASYLQPHKIRTLLEKIGVDEKSQPPSKIRDRFERALDLLVEDGILSFWQYDQWDESYVEKKGWMKHWLDATMIIAPPEDIIHYYNPLEKKKDKKEKTPEISALQAERQMNIGKQLKEKRQEMGLTLQQLSELLTISVSYLSTIERETNIPSANIYSKIVKWLQIE